MALRWYVETIEAPIGFIEIKTGQPMRFTTKTLQYWDDPKQQWVDVPTIKATAVVGATGTLADEGRKE